MGQGITKDSCGGGLTAGTMGQGITKDSCGGGLCTLLVQWDKESQRTVVVVGSGGGLCTLLVQWDKESQGTVVEVDLLLLQWDKESQRTVVVVDSVHCYQNATMITNHMMITVMADTADFCYNTTLQQVLSSACRWGDVQQLTQRPFRQHVTKQFWIQAEYRRPISTLGQLVYRSKKHEVKIQDKLNWEEDLWR